MDEIIAGRKIFSISPDGAKKHLTINIGKPYEVSETKWACPANIEGLYDNLIDPAGIDSWQALNLAISLLKQLLGYYIEDGAELYWGEDGDEVVSLDDLFPQHKSS